MSDHRAIIIAPTFNNAGTLEDVLMRVEAMRLPLLVVNDGCTDSTRSILAGWEKAGRAIVIHHEVNRGKAAALQTGFSAACSAGYTHAGTIDTDGQHDPTDLTRLLECSQKDPDALILGVRAARIDNYPPKNRLGRRLSNLAIRIQTGRRLSDSQCGLRIYPLEATRRLRVRAGHYGFEAEIITRLAWDGAPIVEVPVSCQYPESRVSHFKPGADSLRALLMHARLLTESLARPRKASALSTLPAARRA